MATALSNLSKYNTDLVPSATEMTFGIVVADWNPHITHALYEGCYQTLLQHGTLSENIQTAQVPGAFELTAAARMMIQKHPKIDAIICLGCVIKGETQHDEYINQAVASGLTNLGIMSNRPFIFGLLTTNDEQQALDRAGGKHGNKGVEAAITAIRMSNLKKEFSPDKGKIGF